MSEAQRIYDDVMAESKRAYIAEKERQTAEALRFNSPPPNVDPVTGEIRRTDNQGDTDTAAPTVRDRFLTLDQLANLPPPRPLIDGILDLDSTSITYGRRGAYKSFILLDQALCVSSGIAWQGHATTPGVAVYVVAEGVAGIHQRVAAWQHEHPHANPGDRLLIYPEAVNLLDGSAVVAFAAACAEVDAIFVIFDTLARCLVGGDENSAKDIGIAVASVDMVRRRTGAHVDTVHHSGKDAKAGARGSSALEAAADTVLEVTSSDTLVTLRTTKQKNRAEGAPLTFRADTVGPSVVLRSTSDNAAINVTDKVRDALACLDEVAGDIGATMTAWVEAAADHDVSRTTVRRVRIKALAEGWILDGPNGTKTSPRYVVTGQGRAIAAGMEETTDDQD